MQYALTLVFVETKRGVDALEQWLCMNGLAATAIHGDKVQMVSLFSVLTFSLGIWLSGMNTIKGRMLFNSGMVLSGLCALYFKTWLVGK